MTYLDNAAATPISPETLAFFNEAVTEYYANQEAAHYFAYDTRKALSEASTAISRALTGSDTNRVFWVSSGTEAFHAALSYPAFLKGNVVTTQVEHPAVLNALTRQQAEVRYCKLQQNGRIDQDHLKLQLDDATSLVMIHHVQSELGSIQDLLEIRKAVNDVSPKAAFVVDTVQSVGKLPIPWGEAGIDVLVCAGHKIGAPGGGCVVCREDGSQDFVNYFQSLRDKHYELSRIDPAMALTLSHQIVQLTAAREENLQRITGLNQHLRTALDGLPLKNGKQISCNIPASLASPYILSFLIPGFQSAVIVRALSKQEIHISAGSACEAESPEPSRTLKAIGCSREDAYSGLRVSLWLNNSDEDVQTFCRTLKEVLADY